MKKILLSILTLITLGINAQIVNIPDANFKTFLLVNYDTDTDGEIQVSEAAAVSSLSTMNCSNLSISDLTGIEAFTSLGDLRCNGNSLTSLDVSALSSLYYLESYSNSLTSIKLAPNSAMKFFNTQYNYLDSIENIATATNLKVLSCQYNEIQKLDLSLCTQLLQLKCNDNTSLNYLNLANTNNANMSVFITTSTPSLSCIFVDNVNWATTNWTIANNNIDNTHSFSLEMDTDIFISGNTLGVPFAANTFYQWIDCVSGSISGQTNNSFSPINSGSYACIIDNGNCSLTSKCFTFTSTLGINETPRFINIYPNPTTDKVTFATSEQINNIEIYSLAGKKVAQYQKTNTINISNLPKGIYTAKVLINTGSSSIHKIVKN